MSEEWLCPICGRLNLSGSGPMGTAPICHSCKFSWGYIRELEDLRRQLDSYRDDELYISRRVVNIQDEISSIKVAINLKPEIKADFDDVLLSLEKEESDALADAEKNEAAIQSIRKEIHKLAEIDAKIEAAPLVEKPDVFPRNHHPDFGQSSLGAFI